MVVLSRLMYRKGIDLLIAAIPRLCAAHKDLHFLIGRYCHSGILLLVSLVESVLILFLLTSSFALFWFRFSSLLLSPRGI